MLHKATGSMPSTFEEETEELKLNEDFPVEEEMEEDEEINIEEESEEENSDSPVENEDAESSENITLPNEEEVYSNEVKEELNGFTNQQ